MSAFYNEIDAYCCAWLSNLMDAGHIAPGVICDKSIEDITPDELAGYTQCHFFAGIGVWSLALRSAGWPDSRRAWTGSCPCQPFSAAGKGAGFADERHLWPAWQHLIAQCRPAVVFGEQVASKAVDPWVDLVHADLEGMGYAFGCVPFPSAGVGAPHIRDRNYWVADANSERLERWGVLPERSDQRFVGPHGLAGRMGHAFGEQQAAERGICARPESESSRGGITSRVVDANGRNASAEREQRSGEQRQQPQDRGAGGLADADCITGGQRSAVDTGRDYRSDAQSRTGLGGGVVLDGQRPGPVNGIWRHADWLSCTDGKWRPVDPGTFPLAYGASSRVGRLRAYGNAISAPAAEAFIRSVMEATGRIEVAERAA